MRLIKIALSTLLIGVVLIYIIGTSMESGFGSIIAFVFSLFFFFLLSFATSIVFFVLSIIESIKEKRFKIKSAIYLILTGLSFMGIVYEVFSNITG